jgi:hypothetical protein
VTTTFSPLIEIRIYTAGGVIFTSWEERGFDVAMQAVRDFCTIYDITLAGRHNPKVPADKAGTLTGDIHGTKLSHFRLLQVCDMSGNPR